MTDMMQSPFWRFSLTIYRVPGVPQACLTLQDKHGVDVNVMLYALFLAREGRALPSAELADIIAAMSSWKSNVVVALRGVRRVMKEPADAMGSAAAAFDSAAVLALRDRIKAVELEAERLQQEALYALKPAGEWGRALAPLEAAPANIDAYAQALGAEFDAAARQAMLEGFASTLAAA